MLAKFAWQSGLVYCITICYICNKFVSNKIVTNLFVTCNSSVIYF